MSARGPIIPIPPGAKGTDQPGWTAADYVPAPVPEGWNRGQRLDGLTVIDCDGQGAVDWWSEHGQFTPYVTESRSGHRAYWFIGETTWSGHWALPNGSRAGEVRSGAGRYCVIPPSLHPEGTEYYWMGPDLFEGAGPRPPALGDEALPPRYRKPHDGEAVTDFLTAEWGERLPSEDCPGSGHRTSGAGDLGMQVRDGLIYARCWVDCDFYEVIDKLVADGRYQRDELWPPARAALDAPWVADIAAEEAAAARIKVAEFPTDALPPALAQLVREGSKSICCPPDYIGAAGLAVLGAAIGGQVRLHVGGNWYERAGLWLAIVGDPGARKSPALKPLLLPVWEEQKRLFDTAKSMRAMEKQQAKDDKRPAGYTATGRVVVDDTTMEALHRTLEDNPRGVLMHSDELVGWAKGMGAYKGGLGRDRQHWLSIWSGQNFTVDRKNDEGVPMFVKDPFVAVVGGIQPGVVADIAGGRDDGLIDRLLLAQGGGVPVRLTRERISQATQEEYGALWRRLRLDAVAAGSDVEMGDEAWAVFQQWHDRVADETGQVSPVLRGVWAKMPAQCARIALILSRCAERRGPVDAATMRRAIQLAEYFMGQARLVLAEAGNDTPYERQHAERMDQLEAWFKERPGATMRDVLRKGPGRWSRKRESLDPVLRDLCDAGRVARPD